MSKRRALITGVNGQDGSYLTEFLLTRGYEVLGVDRIPQPPELEATCNLANMFVADLMEPEVLGRLIREVKPDEVYHLAAHHFSSQTDDNRLGRLEPFVNVNLLAVNSALEAIAEELPASRFFYAASAHIFGGPPVSPQNEATQFNPETPYAISKCAGVHLCRYFRRTRGVFASVGILYNHESPRRGPSFITTMLARAAALASLGRPEPLVVKDKDAVVDWGAAQDYVRAMWLMLQQDTPDEYVVASGTGRTVGDFARQAFASAGASAEGIVRQDPAGGHAAMTPMVGDSANLRHQTGWRAEISFEAMVTAMVTEQQRTLRQASVR
jgi:GDPmannose 4,6-dehydratase